MSALALNQPDQRIPPSHLACDCTPSCLFARAVIAPTRGGAQDMASWHNAGERLCPEECCAKPCACAPYQDGSLDGERRLLRHMLIESFEAAGIPFDSIHCTKSVAEEEAAVQSVLQQVRM